MTDETTTLSVPCLYVRVECLAHATDPQPFAAMPWHARLMHDETPLAEVDLVQVHDPAGDPTHAANDLFGPAAAYQVGVAACHAPAVSAGDVIVGETALHIGRWDHDLLVGYLLTRTMGTLRASSAHYTHDAVPEVVSDLLGAQRWSLGATLGIAQAITSQEPVVRAIGSRRSGLWVVPSSA